MIKSAFFYLILITTAAHGVVEYELPAAATSKVFDSTTGMLYVGLATGATTKNAISRFGRLTGTTITASGIASDTKLSGKPIEFLALGQGDCTTPSKLAAVINTGTDFEQKKVIALTIDGSIATETGANLTEYSVGGDTAGIVALEANSSQIFAAVRPTAGNFGAATSGIAVIAVADSTLIQTTSPTTIQLSGASTEINMGGTAAEFQGDVNKNVQLHWDKKLQRLYISVMVISKGTGVRSVVAGRMENNTLVLAPIAPNAAFTAIASWIIGQTGNNVTAHAKHLRVMHASTVGSYLIVNGGLNVDAINSRNSIYALPLVDDTSDEATHGTLAKKDSVIAGGKFTQAATANTDLLSTNEAAELAAAWVGGGPIPLEKTKWPSDMMVIGDAVYVSISENASITANSKKDAGVFSSQALFGPDGRIINWTPWSKRIYPAGAETANSIAFFSVDAVNGKVWSISESDKTKLHSTIWTQGNAQATETKNALVVKLNTSLGQGCFSALDLDWSTRGLGASSTSRYALFGGINKVVFARTSESVATASPRNKSSATSRPYAQKNKTDFSSPADYLETRLPENSGVVTALEYSRRISTAAQNPFQCYFFAGTQNGLYVFAFTTGGAGFSADNLKALNITPFSLSSWTKIEEIKGSVIALKTSGNGDATVKKGGLYILTMEATGDATKPLVSRVYRMNYSATVADMLTDGSPFLLGEFYEHIALGMEIVSTGETADLATADDEQLAIATSQGVFISNASTAGTAKGILSATNVTEANWLISTAGGTGAYDNIFSPDNALIRTKIWPIEIADEKGCKCFDRSIIKQLLGKHDGYGILPANFNSISDSDEFKTVHPTSYFYSDGGRRFLIMKRLSDGSTGNNLSLLPFDTDTWCVSTPNNILTDNALNKLCSFYWVKQIGASGLLMAGHDSGVVSLE